jgi:hypothetical protein
MDGAIGTLVLPGMPAKQKGRVGRHRIAAVMPKETCKSDALGRGRRWRRNRSWRRKRRTLRRGARFCPSFSPWMRLRLGLFRRPLSWHLRTPPRRFMHRQREPGCLPDDGVAGTADHDGNRPHARAERPLLFQDFHVLRCPKASHGVLSRPASPFDHVLFSVADKEARGARPGASMDGIDVDTYLYQK